MSDVTFVKVFGCRPMTDGVANAEAGGSAFENLQGRKSREWIRVAVPHALWRFGRCTWGGGWELLGSSAMIFISPYRAEREMVRSLVADGEFMEVFVDTPIEDCMQRDAKGLYAKAKAGKLKTFTGIDAPYEAPDSPEIHLRTRNHSADELAAIIVRALEEYRIIEKRMKGFAMTSSRLEAPKRLHRSSLPCFTLLSATRPEIAVEKSGLNDAWLTSDRQNVADPQLPMLQARTRGRILTERFYSGQRDGQVTIRDGIGSAQKRLLEPRSVLFKHGEKGSTLPGDASARQIALTLLADALGDEVRAIETHEYFSRRVIALFPERWTITRSRVLAYVDMIEREKPANPTAGA